MKPILTLSIALLATFAWTGCAHRVASRNKGDAPVVVSVGAPSRPAGKNVAVLPASSVARAPEAPKVHAPEVNPLPVLTQAIVEEWEVAAHVNENGELVAPTKKFVIKEPPKWNMAAFKNPTRAYIPAENMAPVPGTRQTTPYAVTGTPATPPTGPAWITSAGADIRVTGIVEKSQRALAEKMAAANEVVIWDDATGYLIVPQAAVANAGVFIPGAAGLRSGKPAEADDEDIK